MNTLFHRHLPGSALALACLLWISAGDHLVRAASEAASTCALIIDYGDGVQKHFPQAPWREGMTVLDLLEFAKGHPRGIRFEYRGKGATAFLTQIDDLKNEGRGRNWVYRINGRLADRSFALQRLQPKDQVIWEFGEYREN
jgi:hypothetical protein